MIFKLSAAPAEVTPNRGFWKRVTFRRLLLLATLPASIAASSRLHAAPASRLGATADGLGAVTPAATPSDGTLIAPAPPAPRSSVAPAPLAPRSSMAPVPLAPLAPLPPLALIAPTAAMAPTFATARMGSTEPMPAAFHPIHGLSPRALTMALRAVACARASGVGGVASRQDVLTIIDYSLPSTQPRLWVLDLSSGKVLFNELVAHGAGSGDNYATRFSNTMDSRQTSLGLFLTGGTYEGGNGYSLKLRGLDPGVNDLAAERNIVMHGAWYVSADHAQRYGRLGRSWGCPALPLQSAHSVIDTIKDGTFIFSYSPAYAGGSFLQASSRPSCPAPATLSAAVR